MLNRVELQFYKTLWGMSGALDEQLAKIKAAKYDGFEDWVRPHAQLLPAKDKHGLKYMAMVAGTNLEQFKADLGEAYDCGASGCTVHAGSAAMEFDAGLDLLGKLVEHTKQVPFPVNFETHRGRLLNEPLSTAKYLLALEDLHLVADLSHWTVVTESMLGPFEKQLDLAIRRTRHIHARVGFEEGPQATDPRQPMWDAHVRKFEEWWDKIRLEHIKRKAETLTVDPEYGPPNYQHTDPTTRKPIADPWEVSLWSRDRLKGRWSKV